MNEGDEYPKEQKASKEIRLYDYYDLNGELWKAKLEYYWSELTIELTNPKGDVKNMMYEESLETSESFFDLMKLDSSDYNAQRLYIFITRAYSAFEFDSTSKIEEWHNFEDISCEFLKNHMTPQHGEKNKYDCETDGGIAFCKDLF